MKKEIVFYSLVGILIWGISSARDTCSKNLTEEEQWIRVGIGAFNDGFYDIAEKRFSHFVRDYPNHGKIYDVCYLLGKSLLMEGKLKEARTVFSKITNENKNFQHMDYALFWAAEVEMKLGNGEEAGKILLSIIRKFPKFEWTDYCYYLSGHLDLGSNRLAQSESSFKKASLLSKSNELTRSSFFWLGILAYKKNDYETAIDYFRPLWEDPKSVPPGYLKYALYWLGEAQLKLGRLNDAKLSYRTFYERFKNDSLIPEVYWRLGYCEYRLGNIKDSIEIFLSFENLFKDSQLAPYTHYLLGEIFLITGDYSSSIKELNFTLNKAQGNVLSGAALLTLYWDYTRLGEIEGSNRIFQRLQRLEHFEDEKLFIQWLNAEMIFSEGRISDSLPYFFNIINTRFRERVLFQIGRGYFFEDKFREAITNLDILLLEFPNSKYLEESLFMKGESLTQLGNLDRALETYDLIVRQSRRNLWQLFALTQVGSIYFFRNENDKAENAFRTVIDSFPNHPLFFHAAVQLGNLHFKKKEVVEAIYYYSTVLKGNILELFGEAYFGLGEIFYQQGKYEKAFTSFEAAMQHLKGSSSWFFLAQLEIGNLQRRQGKYVEAKRSYRMVLDQSKDEDMKKVAKELLNHVESY
jgi:TolA-binding protein